MRRAGASDLGGGRVRPPSARLSSSGRAVAPNRHGPAEVVSHQARRPAAAGNRRRQSAAGRAAARQRAADAAAGICHRRLRRGRLQDAAVGDGGTRRRGVRHRHDRQHITVLRDADKDGKAESRARSSPRAWTVRWGWRSTDGWFYVGNTDAILRWRYTPGQTSLTGTPEVDRESARRRQSLDPHARLQPRRPEALRHRRVRVQRRRRAVAARDDSRDEPRRQHAAALRHRACAMRWASTFRPGIGRTVGLGARARHARRRSGARLRRRAFGTAASTAGRSPTPDPTRTRAARASVPSWWPRRSSPTCCCSRTPRRLAWPSTRARSFPAEYRGDAFLALHGSWNRKQRTGYKVVRIPIRDGKPTGAYEDFIVGWSPADDQPGVWGRPVAILPRVGRLAAGHRRRAERHLARDVQIGD